MERWCEADHARVQAEQTAADVLQRAQTMHATYVKQATELEARSRRYVSQGLEREHQEVEQQLQVLRPTLHKLEVMLKAHTKSTAIVERAAASSVAVLAAAQPGSVTAASNNPAAIGSAGVSPLPPRADTMPPTAMRSQVELAAAPTAPETAVAAQHQQGAHEATSANLAYPLKPVGGGGGGKKVPDWNGLRERLTLATPLTPAESAAASTPTAPLPLSVLSPSWDASTGEEPSVSPGCNMLDYTVQVQGTSYELEVSLPQHVTHARQVTVDMVDELRTIEIACGPTETGQEWEILGIPVPQNADMETCKVAFKGRPYQRLHVTLRLKRSPLSFSRGTRTALLQGQAASNNNSVFPVGNPLTQTFSQHDGAHSPHTPPPVPVPSSSTPVPDNSQASPYASQLATLERLCKKFLGEGLLGKYQEAREMMKVLQTEGGLQHVIGGPEEESHLLQRLQKPLSQIASELEDKHYTILENFLSHDESTELLESVRRLEAEGNMQQGEVEGGFRPSVRGDIMAYVSSADCVSKSEFRTLTARMDALLLQLSENIPELCGKRLLRDAAMCSLYPGSGSRYMRHCDAVGANTNRVLTTIVYLNKDWITSDGGSLRLYPRTEGHVDIAPLLGRALVFWSDGRVPHEVLPAHQPRYAVSLWYYDTADMQ